MDLEATEVVKRIITGKRAVAADFAEKSELCV